MSKYNKPLNEILIDFVASTNIQPNDPIERHQILSWLEKNYPGFSKSTVDSYLTKMSTNLIGRLHHKVFPGKDDVFFKMGPSTYRLYDASHDEPPIYSEVKNHQTSYQNSEEEIEHSAISDDFEEENEIPRKTHSEFAYERDLQNYLVKYLSVLEPGLTLYQDEDKNITGIEYPAGGRYIDILAVDANGDLVVIELKVSRGYDKTFGQILRYIGWIQKDLAKANQSTRGFIVAKEITNDLILATSLVPCIELYEYKLSFSVEKVSMK